MTAIAKAPLIVFSSLIFTFQTFAQSAPKLTATYGSGGYSVRTTDGSYSANAGFRFQLRFFTPFDSDPRSEADFSDAATPALMMRRARFKMDGNVFNPNIRYKFEFDFMTARLIDIYFTFKVHKAFGARVGQYKALYNRERVISSGNGLMIERSIVNRAFTVDRQVGVTLSGNLAGPSAANFTYYLSAHTGAGAHAPVNDDDKFMYIGRLEWNVLGGGIPIGEDDTDLEISAEPVATIGAAASTNSSAFNRFDSGNGGVLLDGYTSNLPGQYQTAQYLQDFVFNYKGFSVMQEYHYKEVEDVAANSTRQMRGLFAQTGFFPSVFMQSLPQELQLVFRYAWLDADADIPSGTNNEYSAGVNWYFSGDFNNRLQADFSVIDMALADGTVSSSRFRLQWDVTF